MGRSGLRARPGRREAFATGRGRQTGLKSASAKDRGCRGPNLADTPPDTPLNSPQQQLAFIRRERDKLAKQIADSKETIAKSQALIERLDQLLANLAAKP
jgi:hypothetical protein